MDITTQSVETKEHLLMQETSNIVKLSYIYKRGLIIVGQLGQQHLLTLLWSFSIKIRKEIVQFAVRKFDLNIAQSEARSNYLF